MDKVNAIQSYIPALTDRLRNEYEAHFFYRAASNWCADKGYTKAAKYFEGEADAEIGHAKKIQEFAANWGNSLSIPTVSVSEEFSSLPDIIYKAYEIEYALYSAYSRDADTTYIDRSYFNLMLEMVQIQYESVAEYRTLVDKLELIDDNKTSVFIYENEVFE